jgi:hypothetical protein
MLSKLWKASAQLVGRAFSERSNTLSRLVENNNIPDALQYVNTMLMCGNVETSDEMKLSAQSFFKAAKSDPYIENNISTMISFNSLAGRCAENQRWMNEIVCKQMKSLPLVTVIEAVHVSFQLKLSMTDTPIYKEFANYMKTFDIDVQLPSVESMINIANAYLQLSYKDTGFWKMYFNILNKLIDIYPELFMKHINSFLMPISYLQKIVPKPYLSKLLAAYVGTLRTTILTHDEFLGSVLLLSKMKCNNPEVWKETDNYMLLVEMDIMDLQAIPEKIMCNLFKYYYEANKNPNPLFNAYVYSIASTSKELSNVEMLHKIIISKFPNDEKKKAYLEKSAK